MNYDNAGRLTQTTLPTNATNSVTYNDSSSTTTVTAGYTSGGTNVSSSMSTVYDGWGRPINIKNVNNGEVDTTFDAMGRLASQTNPYPQGAPPSPNPTTTYAYDALGRQRAITLPDGNTQQKTYSGNQITTTDEVGRQSSSQRDGLGRLISFTEQDSSGNLTQVTSYTYDLMDNLTSTLEIKFFDISHYRY